MTNSVIRAYITELEVKGWTGAKHLNPGLEEEYTRRLLLDLGFEYAHDSLLSFYSEVNGLSDTGGVKLLFLYMLLGQMPMRFEYAISEWKMLVEYDLITPNLFPIMHDGGGGGLLVKSAKNSPDDGSVYSILHGGDEEMMYDSVSSMFQTQLSAMDAGAVWIGNDGEVVRDEDRYWEIFVKLNPVAGKNQFF